MWRYLREFLSDPRVIELPRLIWYPILYGARADDAAAEIRRQVHDDLEQGARRIAAAHLHARPERAAGGSLRGEPDVVVEWGMRYGNPSIASALEPAERQPAATAS